MQRDGSKVSRLSNVEPGVFDDRIEAELKKSMQEKKEKERKELERR